MEPTSYNSFKFTPPVSISKIFLDSTKEEGYYLYDLLSGNKVEAAIDNLHNYDYSLIRVIPVTLQYQNRYYIFSQEELNLWGEARTLHEAKENLVNELINLFKRLNSLSSNKLGPYPLSLLRVLKNYIKTNEAVHFQESSKKIR